MKTSICAWIALLCCTLCPCPCSKAQDATKLIWIAREDNGDKPGIEYRVWLNADGHITGEMWLFVVDENGKDKERGKFPITITARGKRSFAFTYQSSDGSLDRIVIRFSSELNEPRVQAVLEDARSKEQTKLNFQRSVNEK
jgi:hypothetical protein